MKAKTHICPVCSFLICAICHGHRFPPNEKLIEAADKKHGERKTGCACPQGRVKRVYNSATNHPWKVT